MFIVNKCFGSGNRLWQDFARTFRLIGTGESDFHGISALPRCAHSMKVSVGIVNTAIFMHSAWVRYLLNKRKLIGRKICLSPQT